MTLRYSIRLYQQYIVDAFFIIEQSRLYWYETHKVQSGQICIKTYTIMLEKVMKIQILAVSRIFYQRHLLVRDGTKLP